MHAKKLRECTGKGIKPGRGNEKTSRSLLQKALIGRGRIIGARMRESVKSLFETLFISEKPLVRVTRR